MLNRYLILCSILVIGILSHGTHKIVSKAEIKANGWKYGKQLPLAINDTSICEVIQIVSSNGADPGSLIEVTYSGTVGIRLDEGIDNLNERNIYAGIILNQPDSYWKVKAEQQLHFTDYKLQYRSWDGPNVGALPLPDPSLWTFIISSTPAKRIAWKAPGNGVNDNPTLDMIVKDYSFRTVIVTDYFTPAESDAALSKVGGLLTIDNIVPVDPTNVIQRTGKACVDEFEYAYNSWTSEDASAMFDASCTAQSKRPLNSGDYDCYYCHCTQPYPELSCVQSLNKFTGLQTLSISFNRIAWNDAIAIQYTFEPYGPMSVGADIIGHKTDVEDSKHIVRYIWASPYSDYVNDKCVNGYGWRVVVAFAGTDINKGKTPAHIGEIPYRQNKNQPPDAFILGNQYYWDNVHGHYHMDQYIETGFVNKKDKQSVGNATKRGFCLMSVKRVYNNIYSPLTTPYYTCAYQGIGSGWADSYQTGIPCQWEDFTSAVPGDGTLTISLNPKDILCEGAMECITETQERAYIPTDPQLYTCDPQNVCYPINKFKCVHLANETGYLANNKESFTVNRPECGQSYVTLPVSPSGAGQEIGPKRNTEFSLYGQQLRQCLPGASVTLNCSIPRSATGGPSEVIRVCESSVKLGCGTACRWEDAITTKMVVAGPQVTQVKFQCPLAREPTTSYGEPGGYYSTYLALAYLSPNQRNIPKTTCVVA